MRVKVLTREYPPSVYGGAGVHLEYLVPALRRHVDVDVERFAAAGEAPGPGVHAPWDALAGDEPHAAALQTMSTDLVMAAAAGGADVVHSHTWYANLAGHLAGLLYGVPHIVTTHSLEPLRPWKVEQLGGGYGLSLFCERTGVEGAARVIAVSERMRADVLAWYPRVDPERVVAIPNGIDVTEYTPDPATDVLERHGVDPGRPSVLFLGRITRQKGLPHLLDAAELLHPDAQLVLIAGAPDTPAIATQVRERVTALREHRDGVVWIEQVLPRPEVVQLLSHATVFVCPSVYEPFGLVNVEAMACGAAVVATATGGIPEVVVEGETGLLVPIDPADPTGTPRDPAAFASALAERINALVAEPARAAAMGAAGRRRVEAVFGWDIIAERTAAVYRDAVA